MRGEKEIQSCNRNSLKTNKGEGNKKIPPKLKSSVGTKFAGVTI